MYILIVSNTDKNFYQGSHAAATLKVANTQGSTTIRLRIFARILDRTVYTGII